MTPRGLVRGGRGGYLTPAQGRRSTAIRPRMSDSQLSRRAFISGAATIGLGVTIVPRHVLGGAGYTAPSDRLNIAMIGGGGMGASNAVALVHGGRARQARLGAGAPRQRPNAPVIVHEMNWVDAIRHKRAAISPPSSTRPRGAAMRVTNVPEANQYLTRQYRTGWGL